MKLEDVPNVVLFASGKGGVGKTTAASDLARRAAQNGHSVGLVDADISTPNSPEVVGGEGVEIEGQQLSDGDSLIPPTVNGIQLVSQGLALPDDVPVLRDGTWRSEAVADYLRGVEWDDDTELVVIDSPPGSGEELQVVASIGGVSQAFVVTTPHPSSLRDATKTHEFFKQANIDHSTVVNMTAIPARRIAAHVFENADLSTSESALYEDIEDFHLFGYDPDDGVPFGDGVALEVPYIEDAEERIGLYDDLLETIVAPPEVAE